MSRYYETTPEGSGSETELSDKEEEELSATSLEVEEDIDYVLVWDEKISYAKSKPARDKRKLFEGQLQKEGLILSRASLKKKRLHFVKINTPYEVLTRYAEILRFQLPVKEIPGSTAYKRRASVVAWASAYLNWLFGYDQKVFPTRKQTVTANYNKAKAYLFDIDESNADRYFTPAMKGQIVNFILKRKRYKDKTDDERDALAFGIDRLIAKQVYVAAYTLHDGDWQNYQDQRGLLYQHWATFKNSFKLQPLDAVKDYFGTRISIYYAWLGYYANMLIVPSILGVGCFIYGFTTVDYDEFTKDLCNSDRYICPRCTSCQLLPARQMCLNFRVTHLFVNDLSAVFAFFMCIWCVIFLEFWKRYSAGLHHRWDLTHFDEHRDQFPRPEYIATLKNSTKRRFNFITSTVEPAIPFWKMKVPFTLLSYGSMAFLVLVAMTASVGVIIYRVAMSVLFAANAETILLVNVSASLINLVFILIFQNIYYPVSHFLTELEICRTSSEYQGSYAFKLYVLQFVNNYSSILYVAFIKGNFIGHPKKYNRWFGEWRQEECSILCTQEICILLGIVMIGRQVSGNLSQSVIPRLKKCWKHWVHMTYFGWKTHSRDDEGVITLTDEHQIVKDFQLLDFSVEELTNEYMEVIIQFGFITMFISVFPIAPLFALINNITELHFDSQKLLKHYRRPVADRVKGIGVWYNILHFVAIAAVLSNAFIIAFTSNFVEKFVYRFTLHNTTVSLDHYFDSIFTDYNLEDVDGERPPPLPPNAPNLTTCSFVSYRGDRTVNYEHTQTHYIMLLAKVIFVLVFENIVALFFFIIRGLVPDMPEELRNEIQREEFLTNELVIQQELLQARGVQSSRWGFKRN